MNTIKTHNHAVYRKLGVSGRDDAVARGRELGIIFLYGRSFSHRGEHPYRMRRPHFSGWIPRFPVEG